MEDKCFSNAYEIISEYGAVIGSDRHDIANTVIANYSNSNNPLDLLGVAYAYMWQGAKFRQLAIAYIERFISTEYILDSHRDNYNIAMWSMYSSLSKLYEQEYQFDKAIDALKECSKISHNTNSADFTRVGDILVKIDVQQAENYYVDLLSSNKYPQFKRQFAYALDEVLEKKNTGYVYKPRKKSLLSCKADNQNGIRSAV